MTYVEAAAMNQPVLSQSSRAVEVADQSSVMLADLVLDRDDVEGVWDRGFEVCPQRIENYMTSPYGVGTIWAYRPEGRTIHGAIGLHAQKLSLGGKVHSVGQIGNLAVDMKYRSVGPAVRLQRALLASLDGSDRTLIFGITSKAVHVLKRAGCKPVGTAQRWVKILRSETQLKKRLRPPLFAKTAAPLVDIGLRMMSREMFPRRSAGVTVGMGLAFDSRFDRLWERVAAKFPIATQRTAEYLTWRFCGGSDSPYQVLWIADANKELLGYIVYEVRNRDVVEVADVLFDGTPALDRLLIEFLRHIRASEDRISAVSISWFGSTLLADRLKRFGFHSRPEDLQTFVYGDSATLADAEPQIFDTEQWYLTGSDVDL